LQAFGGCLPEVGSPGLRESSSRPEKTSETAR